MEKVNEACPYCEHAEAECYAFREDVHFAYLKHGTQHDSTVSVLQPIFTCCSCKQQWTNYIGEVLRTHAVAEARELEELFLKPCPCCGLRQSSENFDLADALHPTGQLYAMDPDLGYVFFRSDDNPNGLRPKGQVWKYSCRETIGGCGLTISGYSRDEVIKKWNRRSSPAPTVLRSTPGS